MPSSDRIHSLDAVRAYALLLGVVLHSAVSFIEGFPMPILLLTYHYLVRFTWIGVILNGRRHPRPSKPLLPDPAPSV